MINLTATVFLAVLVWAALGVSCTRDRLHARARAVWPLSVLLLAGLVMLVHATIFGPTLLSDHVSLAGSESWQAASPLIFVVVALLAIVMGPTRSHGPRIQASILLLVACAMAAVALDHVIAFALAWVASAYVFHAALLRSRVDEGAARVFFRYHYTSLFLAVVACGTQLLDRAEAVYLWLAAIAIREAVVPVHGWLPRVMDRAPVGLVVAWVAPQLGVIGHFTAISGIVGTDVRHVIAVVAGLTGLFGAVLSVTQREARRVAAWLVVSQTGLVAFGLESMTDVGVAGAVLMWQVMALATSGFLMTLAAVESRRGALRLSDAAGSFARTPRMAVGFLVLGFSSVGLPATMGFVGEDLLLQGTGEEYPILAFTLIATTALNAVSVLRCFFALFSGSRERVAEPDLTRPEWAVITLAIGLLIVGGCLPRVLLS